MPDSGGISGIREDAPAASGPPPGTDAAGSAGAPSSPSRWAERWERNSRWIMPAFIGLLALGGWELVVRANEIPHYVLPAPSLVATALWNDWMTLWPSLMITLKVTFMALGVAVTGGVGLAVLFTLSPWIERSFYPYAIILQVTPIIAIAPLILIYVDNVQLALLICAWIVAFFPILSNTTLGLNSTDHNLRDLFRLYGANRMQTLWRLRLPNAMPYFLGGLKIAGGLSLIGAVVAEFAAGSAGSGSGLAYRILESGYRLNIPRMYAALIMISVTGILIFMATSTIAGLILRNWHESAIRKES